MVIHLPVQSNRRRGSLMAELVVAMVMLTAALLPLAYSLASEKNLARLHYQRAVAVEIVDGEMEALRAGEWRAQPPGAHVYTVRAAAATNLPPGQFLLTIQTNRVRLEWQPAQRQQGGPVVREVMIP